jgi:predicted permease
MGLAVLVLCVAGLVARSLTSLEHVPIALDPGRLLVVELALPKQYMNASVDTARDLVSQLSTHLSGAPGVRGVAPVFTPPFAEVGGVFGRIAAEGQTSDEKARDPVVDYELATPTEFATLGLSIVRGRGFTESDRSGAPAVAVVSESMAREYWPGADPIGKRLARGPHDLITVIGVVSDTHYRDLRHPRPRLYLPLSQSTFPIVPTTLVISTTGEPSSLVPMVRQRIAEEAPGVAIASATPIETYIGGALAQPRLNALLLELFAGAALVLAAVGLFGVMATMVRQRTHELSLRLALGATPGRLGAGVLRQAFAIACAGLVIGLVASLAVTRALQALLFGVSPTDPLTFAVSGSLLLGIALLAAYLPAVRAQRTDPATVLRAD